MDTKTYVEKKTEDVVMIKDGSEWTSRGMSRIFAQVVRRAR